MKPHQLAAQLYTARSCCQTPADTAATLQSLRAIGYASVEIAGIPIPDMSGLRTMIDDAGLTTCAYHGPLDEVLDHPTKSLEALDALSCDLLVYSYPRGFDMTRTEDVQRLIKKLSAAAGVVHQAGKTFCYHHHSLEFTPYGTSTVLEHILEAIDPAILSMELDTYWVQHGGGTPDRWCKKLTGRLPILHLKDYGNIGGTPTMMEIGNGNLDWNLILPAADAAGCQWFAVEQDTCPGNPLDSLKISFDFLSSKFSKP